MKKDNIIRSNPWNEIFESGIPEDLMQPYKGFHFILEKFRKNNVESVLDVAMGSGRHSILLAKENFQVFGFDLSDNAIKLAQAICMNDNLRCEFKKGDMFSTYPYPNNSFDGVIAIQAIYHGYKDDMEFAIKEASRVLKKNGVFSFTVSKKKNRSTLGAKSPKIQEINEDTCLPLSGREAGLVHYYPNESQIRKITSKLFSDVTIMDDNESSYYLVICVGKK